MHIQEQARHVDGSHAGDLDDRRRRLRKRRTALRALGLTILLSTAIAIGAVVWEREPEPATAPSASSGGSLWLSSEEVASLPIRGPSWENVVAAAETMPAVADIADQDSTHDTATLAAALVYVRTGDGLMLEQVLGAIDSAIGSEKGGNTLALARNLIGYVIAADLVELEQRAPRLDDRFRSWLSGVRGVELDGRTLISTHEDRPNNWGTHAGAARVAASAYLGDHADVERAAAVFKGYLGDRSAFDGFSFGSLDWQADESRPVGINPSGARRGGRSLDGVMPDDMRRGGAYRWPPKKTGYVWEGLQGATVQAQLLHRQGFPAWEWEDRALLRAVGFLHELDRQEGGWWAEGDDTWQPWLVNHAYGTQFPAEHPTRPGKNMGWTDWTHAPSHGSEDRRVRTSDLSPN